MRVGIAAVMLVLIVSLPVFSKGRYAEKYCADARFHCIKAEKGQKWKDLWPDDATRHLVMKLNRMNSGLVSGMTIVVPNDLGHTTLMDLTPFPAEIPPPGEKVLRVELPVLAWGAYDSDGKLLNWGPAAGGKDFCPDIQKPCRTVTGTFKIQRKGDAKCKSHTYPVDKPGAPMPYCMFFHGGYALHGSGQVPGFNASHGCVRLWVDDAKWLNQNFVEIGTKVIVTR
jgi:hypothetical protein